MATFTVGTTTTTFDGVVQGVNPGDTIYVTHSTGRDWLTFRRVVGSAVSPVTIVNSGGQVVFDVGADDRMFGIQFDECDYIVFRGDGHSLEFGFKCVEYSNCGVWCHDETEHFEMSYVEVGATKAGAGTGAGIRLGTLVADSSSGFVVDEIHIHDCFVHDTLKEGAYIGKHSDAAGQPQRQIDDLIVEYCRWEDCGYGGCPQIRNAINVAVQFNHVLDCGLTVSPGWAGSGMNIGASGTDAMDGDWQYNVIENCGRGLQLYQDDANIRFHHNLIVGCGDEPGGAQGGINALIAVDSGLILYHNTVVDSLDYGISTKSGDTNGELEDNIVCGSGGDDIDSDWTLDSNETGTTVSQAFTGPWYDLTVSSPAVGAAHDGNDCGWRQY